MAVKWTAEQQQVIDARGSNLLVSAAAGSGKTAVLVERILEMITDPDHPVDIDRLLVVTFTRAAAGEMKERISRAIEERLQADPENQHLQRQSVLLHNARISTIDGFCTYVIQNYFYRTDLDPGYRIAEEGELKQLKQDVLKEMLESEYAAGSEAFFDLTEVLSPGKNDQRIEDLILRLYDFSMASPDPAKWLEACRDNCAAGTEEELQETIWVREAVAEASRIAAGAKELAESNLRLLNRPAAPAQYLPMAQSDIEQIELLSGCETYREWQKALESLTFMRLAGRAKKGMEFDPELQEEYKTRRGELKKMVQDLQKNLFADEPEEILRQLRLIRPHIAELTRLTNRFEALFAEKKRARNLVDFPDLEHYALRILLERTESETDGLLFDGTWKRTEAAEELADRFVEIMIDEYQDSNMLQEYLLGAVSRGNQFMVGDVKQSIYGFRMARPELFLDKYHRYASAGNAEDALPDSDGRRITLGKNFRSRPEVLDFANVLFGRIMCSDLGGIDYDADAALYQGAEFPEDDTRQGDTIPENALSESALPESAKQVDPFQAELLVLDRNAPEFSEDNSRETLVEAEAAMIAGKIKELRENGRVFDRDLGKLRPVQYRDIVILMRSAEARAAEFVRVLQGAGIPANAASRKGYFSAGEVVTVLNYLRILDNPRQDIPFAAVLRSPICGCTDEELAQLRIAYRELPVYEAARRGSESKSGEEAARRGSETKSGEEADGSVPCLQDSLRDKLAAFFENYDLLRGQRATLQVHELIEQVLEKTGYEAFAAAMPAGEQRAANLRMLVETAVAYEQTSYHGLFRFVRYIEQMHSYKIDRGEVNLFGEGEDTVRVMTIHKSKGLEFPIVFLAGLHNAFNQTDLNDTVIQHASFGIGMDAIDLEYRTKVPSLLKKVIRNVNRRDLLGEELRLLYVAVTRAREKLIMTAVLKDPDKQLAGIGHREAQTSGTGRKGVLSYGRRSSANSYLDWILGAWDPDTPAVISYMEPGEIGDDLLRSGRNYMEKIDRLRGILEQGKIEVKADSKRITEQTEAEAGVGGSGWDPDQESPSVRAFLEQKSAYTYPYENLASLPAKRSVSEIKKKSIEEMMEEKGEELFQEEPVIPLIPNFMQEQHKTEESYESYAGAPRGTIYHQVFAALDLPSIRTEADISDQIKEMNAAGMMTEAEAEAVTIDDFMRFIRSPVGQRMAAAAERGSLKREQPFVIDIPANEIDPKYAETEPILVQGVIDAYFEENGAYVIVDYKTDRVRSRTGQDLADKYRVQLQYYRRALEQILDVRVKEMYLYSTELGKEIEVGI